MPELQGRMAGPDFFMIGAYFVLMLGIGVYFYGRMKHIKDYFTGGNTIPWWLSGVSFYMGSFSVAAFVFYPSLCYRYGWVGVTLLWVAVPATVFSAGLFAVKWRRARVDSPVEYIESRYSPLLRQLFAWQGVPVRIIDDGIKLLATGTFISVCIGLDMKWSIIGSGACILLYTFMGGLWAVAVTDFVQFVVLMAGVLIILPLSISRGGGFGAILDGVPEGFFRMTSEEYGWTYVIPVVALYALTWSSTMWSLIQKYYCVPKERDALKVGGLVIALYIIGPPLMFFPAIAATQFMPGVEDAGQIYPLLCKQLLPAGMLGLAIAAMFAATMSTLSGDYNVCASVLTNDVYKRLVRPQAGHRELMFVGRVMTVAIGAIALVVAVLMSNGKSENLFRTMVTLFSIASAPVAVPMLMGLVTRRATNAGAIAGFVCGVIVGLGLYKMSRMAPFELSWAAWDQEAEELTLFGLTLKMEIVMFLSTAGITLLVMEVVGLLFPAPAAVRERVDRFMERLQAPIGSREEDFRTSSSAYSPFRVVGVTVALVGVLLLCVAPWVGGGQVLVLDIIIGGLLIAVGSAMAGFAGKQQSQISDLKSQTSNEVRG